MGALVVGNWKMNGTRARARALAVAVRAAALHGGPEVAVAPPAVHLDAVRAALEGSSVGLASQDCAAEKDGAFTGDLSSEMLADAGCRYAIVGHSERRHGRGETDALVAGKLEAAERAGLIPILCVGERLPERDRGEHEAVVTRQVTEALASGAGRTRLVVAYDLVWAIGTGRVAEPEQVRAMHRVVREALAARLGRAAAQATAVLYGGSVKPDNSAALAATEGVSGALVGGASLDAAAFAAIIAAFSRSSSGSGDPRTPTAGRKTS